jgi:hypothetical protein
VPADPLARFGAKPEAWRDIILDERAGLDRRIDFVECNADVLRLAAAFEVQRGAETEIAIAEQ